MNPTSHERLGSSRPPFWRKSVEVFLIFCVFFVQGGWRAPLANEPHYLGKAKHYWNSDWCSRDFFLQSADAHQVFYWTFGWLSRFLTLPQLAWFGRVLTWTLLAWAWMRLTHALLSPQQGTDFTRTLASRAPYEDNLSTRAVLVSVFSAALFAAFIDRFHMAGEWVIGGVEAKGFAYVLVLFALEAVIRNRWPLAWILLGGATAFHVLVGGWAGVALFVVWIFSADRPSLRRMLPAMFLAAIIALPGLVAAIRLTWGVPPEVLREANRLYVFDRIPHHLVINTFGATLVARHAALVGVFLTLCVIIRGDARLRSVKIFVSASIALSVIGAVITAATWNRPDVAAGLLRYYWYRLGDVLVPLGVALLVVRLIAKWETTRWRWGFALSLAATSFVVAHFGELVFRRWNYPEPPGDAAMIAADDWRATCRWAAQHTARDALFIVPRLASTFRWYAGRAEVVARKDVPQDATGIVQWNRRLRDIFYTGLGAEGFTNTPSRLGAERLRHAAKKYGANYVITRATPPLPFKLVSPAGGEYAIYRLEEPKGDGSAPNDQRSTRALR